MPLSRSLPAAALILALASGSASAALVQVTITGTLNATDVYANTWTSGGITAITNQAYTARMVYDTGILTEARDGFPGNASLGYWDNLVAGCFCEAQLYESFVVSADLTVLGKTIAMDTNFSSRLQANDQAGTDKFYLWGGDTHGPAPDSQDNEYMVVSVERAGLYPSPFVANEAPSSPLSLAVTSPAASGYFEFRLFDYPGCKTLSTTYGGVIAARNCPADRFVDNATHWVAGSGTIGSVTVASVVPVPAGAWLLASALGAMGWVRRRADSQGAKSTF